MSSKKLCRICHGEHLTNKCFSKKFISALKENRLTTKQVSKDLIIPTENVRNWYYKGTGITAYDFMILIRKYDFIKQIFLEELSYTAVN